jgi:hypothetical protein
LRGRRSGGAFLLLEVQALTALAVALRELGREALGAAKEALGVHEQGGHEPGRAETAALLADLEGSMRSSATWSAGTRPRPPR